MAPKVSTKVSSINGGWKPNPQPPLPFPSQNTANQPSSSRLPHLSQKKPGIHFEQPLTTSTQKIPFQRKENNFKRNEKPAKSFNSSASQKQAADKGKAPEYLLDKGKVPLQTHKPPVATFDWQTVTPRNKSQKRQMGGDLPSMLTKVKFERKCYKCLQFGHFKASCKSTIKCLHCGKFGHKYASCFQLKSQIHKAKLTEEKKHFTNPSTSQAKTGPRSVPQHTFKQPVITKHQRKMEPFFNERPAIGEDFNPECEVLNPNNAYLTSTGMIILLQGDITPNLSGNIQDCLAYVHQRPLQAYQVVPAQISPFLVICTDPETRDAVVRGGIYHIPSRNVRFRVNEWKPRFGMANDPLTHQTWVRLIGLPLQAWTYEEIRRFVRSFGNPIRILPFGRAAGHFNFIEVLIGTKHPRHIPLSKRYREGDSSTLVDIRVTIWREWEESPFYPPHDDDLPPHQQIPRRAPPPPPPHSPSHNHSSSSSSDRGTYFSANWSPRSPRNWSMSRTVRKPTVNKACKPVKTKKWKTKAKKVTIWRPKSKEAIKTKPPPIAIHNFKKVVLWKPPTIDAEALLTMAMELTWKLAQGQATIDPVDGSLAAISSLSMDSILGFFRKPLVAPFQSTIGTNSLRILKRGSSLECLKLQNAQIGDIKKKSQLPAALTYPEQEFSLQFGKGPMFTFSTPIMCPPFSSFRLPAEDESLFERGKHMKDLKACTSFVFGPTSSFEEKRAFKQMGLLLPNIASVTNPATQPNMNPTQMQLETETCASSGESWKIPNAQMKKAHTGKDKHQCKTPIRRSIRLASKTTATASKKKAKAKTEPSRIPFDIISKTSPLTKEQSLSILQVSGMYVTDAIIDMLDKAMEQDFSQVSTSMDAQKIVADDSTPTTPVHDTILPLQIKGGEVEFF